MYDELDENEVPKIKVYVISCSTGCTCCSEDNHHRGPYRTREDAERRINFFLNSQGSERFNPVASQFSARGNYYVEELEAEKYEHKNNIVLFINKGYGASTGAFYSENDYWKVYDFIHVDENGKADNCLEKL